jgi:fatty-acid desaturase
LRCAVPSICFKWWESPSVTIGYHRYLSHRSFKTSRVFQFVLAWLGCSAAQKGPLWWELDVSYYLIRLLAFVGLVWDVRTPPAEKLSSVIP